MRGGGERRATFCGDARDLRFGTLVGRFRHTRVLLHRQSAHGRLRFGGKRLLIIGTIVDAGADEHLAGQRLRLEFVILIVFGHICCFLSFSASSHMRVMRIPCYARIRIAMHTKNARTHCDSAFGRFVNATYDSNTSSHRRRYGRRLWNGRRAIARKTGVRRRPADWRSGRRNGGRRLRPPIPAWRPAWCSRHPGRASARRSAWPAWWRRAR